MHAWLSISNCTEHHRRIILQWGNIFKFFPDIIMTSGIYLMLGVVSQVTLKKSFL